MSPSEQKTLRAVIAGDCRPLRTAVLERLDLDKTTAFKVLKRLIERADLEKDDRSYLIVDPIFEDWIRRLSQLDLAAYGPSV